MGNLVDKVSQLGGSLSWQKTPNGRSSLMIMKRMKVNDIVKYVVEPLPYGGCAI